MNRWPAGARPSDELRRELRRLPRPPDIEPRRARLNSSVALAAALVLTVALAGAMVLLVASGTKSRALAMSSLPAVESVAAPVPAAAPPQAQPDPVHASTQVAARQVEGWLDQVEQPWLREDWSKVVALLERARQVEPENSEVNRTLAAARLAWGYALTDEEQWEEALAQFNLALAIRPDDAAVRQTVQLASAYLNGLTAFEQERWAEAAQNLETVYALDPEFQVVPLLLYAAYYRQGTAAQAAGQLALAQQHYRRALEIRPDGVEAKTGLAEVSAPKPPAPISSPPAAVSTAARVVEKWIDIDLSEQRLRAYEGRRVVFSTKVSTGTRRYPTVQGRFQIYAKVPSQTMRGGSRLRGDYYYLPRVPNVMYFFRGYSLHGTYWHNNFGRPMSHGCVNLPLADAKWLFAWAPLGTTVVVHR